MKNQFYYTRKQELPLKEGETEPKFKELSDSFNVNKVIRTAEFPEGILVVLDDFHEEMREVPAFHPKTRKPMGVYVKERNTYQSEIMLSKEDGDRLKKIIEL